MSFAQTFWTVKADKGQKERVKGKLVNEYGFISSTEKYSETAKPFCFVFK